MNSVHCRVGSLGKCTSCTHPDCVVPEPAAAERPSARENQMMLRTQWYPFQDLRSAQEERAQDQMDRLFAHALGMHGQWQSTTGASTRAWAPALDITEGKDAYLVAVELPGVKLDDLEITLEDGLLTIQGERQFPSESSEEQFHRVERSSGAFRRAITLPAHVEADAVEASMEDGVLRIMAPKAEEAKPKRIQVNPGGQMTAIAASSRPS
jgi:HSP20 family protein